MKFQGITQHIYSTGPQGILAQVQRDQVLIASKGRREFCTTEGSDGTSPQPVGETHTFTDLLSQCSLVVDAMPCARHTLGRQRSLWSGLIWRLLWFTVNLGIKFYVWV